MNNHFSPKAPKPLLWPQTPLGVSLPLLRLPCLSFGCPAAPSVAPPLLRLPCRSFGSHAAPSVGEPIFLHSHSSLATPLVAYSGARSARKASSRAPNRQICSRGPHPASSRAPNRQICSRDPPPSIPEPVDESILSTYKFVIKPDVIRIAVLLTEVGEGIFTARSRVARFAVSLNE